MKKRTKLDKPLLIVMLVFVIFGLIMILSASSMASYMRYNNSIYYYFITKTLNCQETIIAAPVNKSTGTALVILLELKAFYHTIIHLR